MRTTFLLPALLSASAVVAMPASTKLFQRSEYCDKSPADGRGATIFKQQDLAGDRVATDYTPIPVTDDFCFNLSSTYGGWYGAARSLVVNDGFKCEFYTEFQCAGEVLCLSGTDGAQNIQTSLPEGFDSAIKSVQCRAL
ncbi:hypothetical protein CC80DRAFT_495381 [Byssothecium circinans]|uniref:Uncharacterized protein n=1 Tax=Byssothecium circinans TaxID=147558 RepID=A0A6A5TNB7_9PLEO|nr:hypothetical protein CC80DRAFT_495381 [Byssothecium circinans]